MGQRVLENDELKAVISDHGAELISLWDKREGRELIWEADPAVWDRHAPVLFPFVGKVNGGQYRYEGRVYEMKRQHGFARDTDFDCVREEAGQVIHRMTDTEETREIYPFSFVFEVVHTLEGRSLTEEYRIRNTGDHTMYYSVGGHPGFAVVPGTKRSEYQLRFEGKDSVEYILIDPVSTAAKTDTVYQLSLTDGCCGVPDDMFDRDALIMDGDQVQKVEILHADGTSYVCMETEGFPSFGIWSQPDGPYICLEPWAGRVDDVGFCGEIRDKFGIQKVEAGTCDSKKFKVTV